MVFSNQKHCKFNANLAELVANTFFSSTLHAFLFPHCVQSVGQAFWPGVLDVQLRTPVTVQLQDLFLATHG